MHSKTGGGRLVAAVVGIAVSVGGQAALAQDTGGLEEVVVTAQKRSENLQSVPIAATALTEEALQTRFVKSFIDVGAALPNASLESEGLSNYASSFYIRGQGTLNRGPFVDPAVSVLVDGVAGGYIATALTDMIDIESIEVLRGPQGTIQGRNSTGGAILVRHKRPEMDGLKGNVGLLAGNAGRFDVSGVLNAPVSDQAAFRIAAKYTKTDGFFRNSFSGKDVNGQSRVTVLPSFGLAGDNWNLTVRGLFNSYNDDSSTLVPRYACRIDPRVNPNTTQNDTYVNAVALRLGGAAAYQYCGQSPSTSMFTVNQNRPIDSAELDQRGGTVEYNYTFDGTGTVTFVGNYQKNEETSALDVDGTPLQLNSNQENTKHNQKSAELRFASDFSDRLGFIGGVFWLDQHYDLRRTTSVDGAAATVTPMLNTLFGGSSQGNTQKGVFLQGEWKFTDSLTGVLGARYTQDKKDIIVCGATAAPCDGRFQANAADWSDTTPRVGLNWQRTENQFFYAYWAKGFRAGGFNGEAGTASAAGPFDPEEIKTVEIGSKFDLVQNRLRLNIALFDTKAENLQRQLSRATPAGVAEVVTQNAAAAKFRGAEAELTWLVVDDFRLETAVGYLDAKYTDYCKDLNGVAANDPSLVACAPAQIVTGGVIQPVDLTGLPIARSPKFTTRLAGYYTWNVGDRGSLELTAEWAHQDKQFGLDQGAPVGTTLGITNFDGGKVDPGRDATNVINASINWKDSSDRYRIALYGKNLTNEVWFRRLGFASPTLSFGTLSDPREYGVSLQYNFGAK